MKDCKMIYTEKAVKYLEELGITESIPKGNPSTRTFYKFIYIEKKHFTIGATASSFCSNTLPFLEERDLLKMGPSIAAGDFIQVPVANGFFIREVSKVTAFKVFIKDNPTVHYNIEGVRRAPDKLISYLKNGGFLDD